MIETLLLLQGTAPTPQTAAWIDASVRYALVLLIGWVAAAMQFGKKLSAHDKALRAVIDENQRVNTARYDQMDRDISRLSSEVWGPHGESGLRKDVNELQLEVKAQTKLLTQILTTVKHIHRTSTGKPHEDDDAL